MFSFPSSYFAIGGSEGSDGCVVLVTHWGGWGGELFAESFFRQSRLSSYHADHDRSDIFRPTVRRQVDETHLPANQPAIAAMAAAVVPDALEAVSFENVPNLIVCKL